VEEELRRANSVLAATLDATAEGVLVVDLEGRITHFNQRFVEMWRLNDEFLAIADGDRTLRHVVEHLRDPEEFLAKVMALNDDPGAESHDLVEFRDGRVFERDSRPQRLDGEVIGRVWSFRDITAHRMLQRELARQAVHDPLTGLANQVLFRDRVRDATGRLGRSGERMAILFIDLDDFKTVNDSLGHSAGDHLLVTVADRLRNCVRGEDTVARLGGDEFALLIEDLRHESDALEIAQRVLAVVGEPVDVAGHRVRTSASIGVVFGTSGDGCDALLRNADLAMYEAKNAGRDCFRVFADEMHQNALRRLETDSRLRLAVQAGELELHYQPVVNLTDGRIEALEALVRWHHPDHGVLLPGDFVPFAEESGLIHALGAHVLGVACAEAATWGELLADGGPRVAVNLSPRQLLDDRLPDRVDALLDESGCPASRLEFELTESALMQDPATVGRRLGQLKELGVRLALDDFGTGYSSLSHLRRFPLDALKIDRQFVAEVLEHPGPSVVRAVVELARALSLDIVAEGVETPEQQVAVTELGCDLAQGFLFARPMEAADARMLLIRGAGFGADPGLADAGL
jgi:diguanylate cyclase (GGDEF)-like protein/PAS domain S-box-containing protein